MLRRPGETFSNLLHGANLLTFPAALSMLVVKAVQKFVHMHTSGVLNTELDQICRFLIKFEFLFTQNNELILCRNLLSLVKLRVNEKFNQVCTLFVCGLVGLKG